MISQNFKIRMGSFSLLYALITPLISKGFNLVISTMKGTKFVLCAVSLSLTTAYSHSRSIHFQSTFHIIGADFI